YGPCGGSLAVWAATPSRSSGPPPESICRCWESRLLAPSPIRSLPYNRGIRMPTSLGQIIEATRLRVEKGKATADRRALEKAAERHVPRGFRESLAARSTSAPAIIAELKKASPSRGLIRAEFHPESLARELETAGASALSVLTDEQFFQGSLENLRIASASVTIPCLRKDFIVDEFQLVEARAASADAVLLIVAALTDAELKTLSRGARALG